MRWIGVALAIAAVAFALAKSEWRPGAQRDLNEASAAEASQTPRILLLSDKAKAAPIPILEIEAYDVARCSHGASAGPLDLRAPGRFMSTMHAVLRRSDRGWTVEDAGSKNGTTRSFSRSAAVIGVLRS